jgi:murein DD-endopeptidase MepM/ murein hydrolase activator NlpD
MRRVAFPIKAAVWLLASALVVLWPEWIQDESPPVMDWLPVAREMVRPGDTLESLVRRFDLPVSLVPQLVTACEGVADLRRLRPDEPMLLVKRSMGDSLRLVHYLDISHLLVLDLPFVWRGDSLAPLAGMVAGARLEPLDAALRLVARTGTVDATLYDAMVGAGGSPQLALAYADIFQWDVDFLTDIHGGESFQLLVEEKRLARPYLGDSLTVEGRILAATFKPAGDGRALRALWFEGCGESGYYDEAGRSFQKAFLKSPLSYRRVSSSFGMRNHPVLRRVRMHHGIDYSAPHGTPVVAAGAGTVAGAGWERGYGNVVRIRHDGKRSTVYGHLSSIAPGVRRGARVDQNQLIGRVGSTGLSTGPHLHYEVIENGRSVDPSRIRTEPGKPVPASCRDEYLDAFARRFPQ